MTAIAAEIGCAFESALQDFERAADRIGLEEDLRRILRQPEEESTHPLTLENGGTPRVAGAWTVRHNSSRGPARGAACFHRGLTLSGIRAKAMFATWRWAALDIPLGGAAAGAAAETSELPPAEIERLSAQSFSSGIHHAPAGVECAALAACRRLSLAPSGLRVAVFGFGKVGSAAALRLSQLGATIVAASDTRGAICCPGGLDVASVLRHKTLDGSVVGIHGADPITDCELLALDADLLIVSAMQGAVHNRNAPDVGARIVIEAVDDGITPQARQILDDKGTLAVPSLLAAAGRHAVPYFESIGVPDPLASFERVLDRAIQEALSISANLHVSLRRAAEILAVSRVAAAIKRSQP